MGGLVRPVEWVGSADLQTTVLKQTLSTLCSVYARDEFELPTRVSFGFRTTMDGFDGWPHIALFQLRSPVFFGKLSEALTRREAFRGEGNLAALKALIDGASFDRRSSRGGARQEESAGRSNSSPRSTCQVGDSVDAAYRARGRAK